MSTAAKKTDTKEVTKAHLAGVPAVSKPRMPEHIDADDVILPGVYLMQSNSDWVKEEKARNGEFVKSTTYKAIGGRGKPVEFVPLSFYKSFRIVEPQGNKWVRNEAWDPAKSGEWEFVEEGRPLKRVKCVNVYALLMPELVAEAAEMEACKKSGEMFDLEKALTPIMITFRNTSFKAGKILTDHFAKAQKYNSEPFVNTFTLDSYEDSNDDGSFYVADVLTSGKLPKEFYETCGYWRELILGGKTKVAEVQDVTVEDTTPSQF